MRTGFAILAAAMLALTACDGELVVNPGSGAPSGETAQPTPPPDAATRAAVNRFDPVVARMEPLTEQACRERTRGVNCDFRVVVIQDPEAPSNAYQTEDRSGRPILVFTAALLKEARNTHEMAFVFGHEAAHHIQEHIAQTSRNAATGAILASAIAVLAGADAGTVQEAQRAGATVGARRYSKEYELEADQLGTILTMRAGYDALAGSQFFNRIPDPGDRFLGTHPPNAQRRAIVARTVCEERARAAGRTPSC